MGGAGMTDTDLPMEARTVLTFWFGTEAASTSADLNAKLSWWFGDTEMAREMREQFVPVTEAAAAGGLLEWEETRLGKLALIVILDQFRRTLYGLNDRRAFAEERRASRLALELVQEGIPGDWSAEQHFFAMMPLGHSEDLATHKPALSASILLVERAPLHLRPIFETVTAQLIRFTSVIERFGRFPHRNEALGRKSTPEELEFLKSWRIRHPAHDYSAQIAVAQGIEENARSSDSGD